jgi:hypothetical protein
MDPLYPGRSVVPFSDRLNSSRNSSYIQVLDIFPRLDFLAVITLFPAWSSGKAIGIVILSALMVLRSEMLLFWALNRADRLILEVLKTNKSS